MQKNILFISQKQNRGGAIYEEQVRKILVSKAILDILELNASKNKMLIFTKLKYFYQIKSYKPFKHFRTLITNKAGVYAGALSRKADKKILVLHHYYGNENVHSFLNPFLKNKLLSSLKKFDKIVVVSSYWKDFFSEYVAAEKIDIIYNSFDTKKISSIANSFAKDAFRKKYNIPADKTIVYAGNALEIKGYKEVVKHLDNEKYFIITTGSKDKDAELKHLHLMLAYSDYIQLLCCVDVTVLLSKFPEGWNRIAHESLLCNTPVIGTDTGGMGELLNRANQFVWKEGDDLKKMIDIAVADKGAVKLGHEYASQYNLEYFKEKWESVLS